MAGLSRTSSELFSKISLTDAGVMFNMVPDKITLITYQYKFKIN